MALPHQNAHGLKWSSNHHSQADDDGTPPHPSSSSSTFSAASAPSSRLSLRSSNRHQDGVKNVPTKLSPRKKGSTDAKSHQEPRILLQQPGAMQPHQHRTFYTDAEWEKWKPLMTDLYIERGMKLAEIMEYMASSCDFHAGISSYKLRFRTWALKKNYTSAQKDAIAAQLETQGRRKRASKELMVNNKPVRMDKIQRHQRSRQRQAIETLAPFVLSDNGEIWLRHIYTAFKTAPTGENDRSLAYWCSAESQTIWLRGLQLYSGVYTGIFWLEQSEFEQGRRELDQALEYAKEIINSRMLTFTAIIVSLIADPIWKRHPDLRRIVFKFFASMCARVLGKKHCLAQLARMAADYNPIEHAIAGADRFNVQMWREIVHTETMTAPEVHDIMLSGWLHVAPELQQAAVMCWAQTSMINQTLNSDGADNGRQPRERPLSMWYAEGNQINEDLKDRALGSGLFANHDFSITAASLNQVDLMHGFPHQDNTLSESSLISSTAISAPALDYNAANPSTSVTGGDPAGVDVAGDTKNASPIFDWLWNKPRKRLNKQTPGDTFFAQSQYVPDHRMQIRGRNNDGNDRLKHIDAEDEDDYNDYDDDDDDDDDDEDEDEDCDFEIDPGCGNPSPSTQAVNTVDIVGDIEPWRRITRSRCPMKKCFPADAIPARASAEVSRLAQVLRSSPPGSGSGSGSGSSTVSASDAQRRSSLASGLGSNSSRCDHSTGSGAGSTYSNPSSASVSGSVSGMGTAAGFHAGTRHPSCTISRSQSPASSTVGSVRREFLE